MSNLIKAENVRMVPSNQPRFFTIQIPLIDTGDLLSRKQEKVKEEIDKLLNEFCIGTVHEGHALMEMFDVVQTVIGYLYTAHKEHMSPETANELLSRMVKFFNEQHVEKIEHYAVDRGWKVFRDDQKATV